MSLISNVKCYPRDHKTVKASGSFTIAKAFDVKFTLIKGPDGLFVGLPSRTYEKDGETKRSYEVYCSDEDVRREMTAAIISAYNEQNKSSEKAAPEKEKSGTASTTKRSVPF